MLEKWLDNTMVKRQSSVLEILSGKHLRIKSLNKTEFLIMMSPDDQALEDLLYGSDPGDKPEVVGLASGPTAVGENTASENVPATVSIQEPIICAGCGEQVCDRFFLLAAGRVWHSICLRCSQCHCELQTQTSLYWRDGNIYCQQDYSRIFGGGQCARCLQPIPPTDLVMRSGELTFHPHCFSCQECDVKLVPGNLYCMQGQNLYCESHYHCDGDNLPLQDSPQSHLKEEMGQNQVSGEGEESVSSPEPRLEDRDAGGRTRRRTKRIRTCFRSEQLRALESYFSQKQNPDGKDWTCLAHKTGLPKRVLQVYRQANGYGSIKAPTTFQNRMKRRKVWFQNARAKLRRSLNSEDSQANSPSAPLGAVTLAATPSSLTCSSLDQLQPFPTSTIDQLQLSLLTGPVGEPSVSPILNQSCQMLQSPNIFLDYDPQSAFGCIPSLEPLQEFEESEGRVEREVDAATFGPNYS